MKNHKTLRNTLCACVAMLYLVFATVYVIYVPQKTVFPASTTQLKEKITQAQFSAVKTAEHGAVKSRFARPRVILDKKTIFNPDAILLTGVLLLGLFYSYQRKEYQNAYCAPPVVNQNKLAVLCIRQV